MLVRWKYKKFTLYYLPEQRSTAGKKAAYLRLIDSHQSFLENCWKKLSSFKREKQIIIRYLFSWLTGSYTWANIQVEYWKVPSTICWELNCQQIFGKMPRSTQKSKCVFEGKKKTHTHTIQCTYTHTHSVRTQIRPPR